MQGDSASVLVINGGSSSIKFAFFESGEPPRRSLRGRMERIGLPDTRLSFQAADGQAPESRSIAASDYHSATNQLIDWLETLPAFTSIGAVGHRVVHGMSHSEPELVTPALLGELKRIAPYDPDHLPGEIALIEAFQRRRPGLAQVACFDTAFHRGMPRVAKLLPLPRRYDARGVQRYGFHGLSYAYLLEELARVAGAHGRAGPRGHGAPRERRQPRRGARGKMRRHQHGLHADCRNPHGHALG